MMDVLVATEAGNQTVAPQDLEKWP